MHWSFLPFCQDVQLLLRQLLLFQLLGCLMRDFTREGWLSKTGPRPTDSYKKRWFTLDERKLMYHDDPLVSHTFILCAANYQ